MKTLTDLWASASRQDAALALAALAVASLVAQRLARPAKDARKPLHRPATTLPVLGNLLDMGKQQERFNDWLNDVSESFDNEPWVLAIPGRSASLVISRPEDYEDVLKTKADVFLRGPEGQYISHDMFGNGVAIADGDPWVFHRKTASAMFSTHNMRHVMQEVVREKLAVLVHGLRGYVALGQRVSLARELGHFTMDVFSKIGFGVEQRTLEAGFADPLGTSRLNEAFTLACEGFGARVETPIWLWRLKRFFNIGSEKIFRENMDIINKLVFDVIDKSMALKRDSSGQGLAGRKDLISLFLESDRNETGITLKEDEATIMRDMVFNFIFAGKDSSAHAMDWFTVNVNRHPHVLAKIRQEMHDKLPGLLSGEIQVPTVAQVDELVYLEAAIRESIRLYPSTGFLVRQAMEDTVLHDGTFVEKDMTVMLAFWCNSRNKKAWGPDAAEYKPERWIDPQTGKLLVVSPFKFSSFGGGQHICLGQKFALMEIKLAMATLWSKFDFKTVEKPEDITYAFSLQILPKGPLLCDVTPVAAASPVAA